MYNSQTVDVVATSTQVPAAVTVTVNMASAPRHDLLAGARPRYYAVALDPYAQPVNHLDPGYT